MRNIAQIHTSRSNGTNDIVAANVRAALAYSGLRQAVLADVLGVSAMAVSRRLASQTEFTTGEIGLLADFFDVEPGDLFSTHRPLNAKKAPTPRGGGPSLPGLDSNQEPAG